MKERYTDFSVTDRDLQSMSLPSKEIQPYSSNQTVKYEFCSSTIA